MIVVLCRSAALFAWHQSTRALVWSRDLSSCKVGFLLSTASVYLPPWAGRMVVGSQVVTQNSMVKRTAIEQRKKLGSDCSREILPQSDRVARANGAQYESP